MIRPVVAVAAAAACWAAAPSGAAAEVVRFAVLVGHNRGEGDEADLRYAEADAQKMRDVLVEVGGFRHEDVILMPGIDAVAMRQTIVAMNERIRTRYGSSQTVLLVYYSGHADAESLHLGKTRFSNRELEQLVSGSAADVRLLVVDSCRSGALTRTKGGAKGPSFAIRLDERLASEGAVFLTSSAANEDAQESNDLKGSFFTHYLVSGMLGAADENGDGRVNLSEVYRYAYENTLRASSRTLGGMQHPSFRYTFSGHGDLVLTWLRAHQERRGWLAFPEGRTYLILERDADGPVVAEVGLWDRRRTISVREGRYFVRGRGRRELVEGLVDVAASENHEVRDAELDRIAYDRLVRKGSGVLDLVHGPQLAMRARTALSNTDGLSWGLVAGYLLELDRFNLSFRLNYQRGHGRFQTSADPDEERTRGVVDEFGAEVRLAVGWDTRWFALEPFITAGGGVMHQTLDNDDEATSAAAHLDAGAALRRALVGPSYFFAEGAAQTYWFRQRPENDELAPSVGFAFTSGLGLWLP